MTKEPGQALMEAMDAESQKEHGWKPREWHRQPEQSKQRFARIEAAVLAATPSAAVTSKTETQS